MFNKFKNAFMSKREKSKLEDELTELKMSLSDKLKEKNEKNELDVPYVITLLEEIENVNAEIDETDAEIDENLDAIKTEAGEIGDSISAKTKELTESIGDKISGNEETQEVEKTKINKTTSTEKVQNKENKKDLTD